MIKNPATLLLLLTVISTSGCFWNRHGKGVSAARIQEPPLSEKMTTQELVDHINQQNRDLNGWQSTATRMEVRLPNMIPQRLSGSIACQTPNYFRLTADNLVAKTDLGSNNHRCWFYVQPGESAVMTWKHEDTPLLQQVPLGVPHIDPNWLMLVLGITPLNAADYQIRSAANQQLWLESIAASPSGRPLRRVIKVDRMHHVVREHLIADSEANVLVKAVLSDHRWKDNRLIPHRVNLDFPQMKTQIRLTFREIETNPSLPDSLWHLPDSEVEVVDLGQIVRHKIAAENPHLADQLLGQSSAFSEVTPAADFQEVRPSSVYADNRPFPPTASPDIRLEQPQFERPAAASDNPFAQYESGAADRGFGNEGAFRDGAVRDGQVFGSPGSTPTASDPPPIDHGFFGASPAAIPEPEWSTSSISHTRPEPPPEKRRFFDRMLGR